MRKAFTLIEVLVVVCILGILAALAAPTIVRKVQAQPAVETVPQAAEQPIEDRTKMPTGFTLICDGKGRYSHRKANGFTSISISNSAKNAIEFAWRMVDEDAEKWHECTGDKK